MRSAAYARHVSTQPWAMPTEPAASEMRPLSSAGLQGQASQINYGAAKAGIAAMTIIASLALKRYGVRAN